MDTKINFMTLHDKAEAREDFLKLTSDMAIRGAAYPLQEWIDNGGIRTNYENVMMQDDSSVIYLNSGGILAPQQVISQSESARKHNLELYRNKIESHKYFIELESNHSFKHACMLFEKKRSSVNASIFLKSDLADFRFYNLVSEHIGWQIICDSIGYSQAYADAKLVKKAKIHIDKLLQDFEHGISLSEKIDQIALSRHLKQLQTEISRKPRKDRETPTAQKRRALKDFISNYMAVFNDTSAPILAELAAMLDWQDCHERTIDDIISSAKKIRK